MKKTLNAYLYPVKRGAALLILGSLVFLFSCSDDEAGDPSEGFSNEIKNFVPDSTIAKLREMGMEINEGTQPPVIEGIYSASPMIMLETSVPDDSYSEGHRFNDYIYRFKDQDSETLFINLDTKGINLNDGNVQSLSEGNGAFLSGFEDTFTAFIEFENKVYYDGDTVKSRTLEVISGRIVDNGIEDFQLALMMLDNYGNESGHFIPNNTGRLFHDSDYLASRATSFRIAYSGGDDKSNIPVSILMR